MTITLRADAGPAAAAAASVEELRAIVNQLVARVQQLEGEVTVLRSQKGEGGGPAPAAASKPGVEVKLDRKGLKFSDKAGGYEIALHGQIQVDSRFELSDDIDSEDDNTFFIRRARPRINGRLGDLVDFEMRWDLIEGVYLTDAWAQLRLAGEAAKLRAGIFKQPFGLDRTQASSDLWFMERALTFNLTTGRDLGVEVAGSLDEGLFEYHVGLFNGINDGRRSYWEPNSNEGFDFAGSVLLRPFQGNAESPLAGLWLGMAGTWGTEDGPVSNVGGGPTRYRTVARDEFFSLETEDTRYDGDRYRLNPQLYYFLGPFGLLAEFIHSSQDLARGDEISDEVAHTISTDAWMVEAQWVLTGEDATFGAAVPEHPFGRGGGWGWWSIAARYSALDTDSGAFEGDDATRLAADGSAGDANAWGFSLNWYPIANFKWMLGFEQTLFNGDAGDPSGNDRQTENVIQSRFQVTF